jgi:putative tryptophan/tyrosine transport system substrate-binding protein
MRRRDFISGLGASAAWPLAAGAQRSLSTIGWLHTETPETHQAFMHAFYEGLAEIGYEEGRNIAIEHRWAEGHAERRPALADDLVARQVAVIVVDTTGFAQIAKAKTQTIPIVFASAGADPVDFGLVASFNRPGGNVTGVALRGIDITGKRLELLRKLVPAAGLIGVLVGDASSQFSRNETSELQSAARVLSERWLILNVAKESDVEAAFSVLIEQRAGALLLSANIVVQRARAQIISLAARHAMPTMFWDSVSAAAGALSSYGPDFGNAYRQAGLYTGRILKGEKPANLPVVQPSKYTFVINLKTAKMLDNFSVPPTVLALADEIIE